MFLLYVDESGDIGREAGSSRYFALSGFVVHELKWHETLELIINERRRLREKFGLKLRDEIQSGHMIRKPGS